MAGLGFKDFQVGEVLTSSDVDGYLMQQAVMRFADAGARGSALGTAVGTAVALAEGMLTYLDDLNAVQVYDGTAWRDPSVGIGSNVVQTVKTDTFSTTSTSFTDVTGVSLSITPSTAASKVLVIVQGVYHHSTATEGLYWNIVRDSTAIAQASGSPAQTQLAYDNNTVTSTLFGMTFLDSPATTSATTYKMQARVAGGTVFIGRAGVADIRSVTTITAIEVAA